MYGQRARRSAAILMGVLLVFFMAPRGLFHECAHAAAHDRAATDDMSISAPADCPVCEMVAPAFDRAGPSFAEVPSARCVGRIAPGPVDVTIRSGSPASGRGPPARVGTLSA